MTAAPDPATIAASLTPAQWHVMSRCSTGSWAMDEGCFGRTWPDLVHGARHVGYRSIRVLLRLGVLYKREGRPIDLYGLTPFGAAVLLNRPR